MTDFAKALEGFAGEIENDETRRDFKAALAYLPTIEFHVITAEKANKGLPKLRRNAREGIASAIANRGVITSPQDVDVMISMGQLMAIITGVFHGAESNVAARQPAGAILAQLEPTNPSLVSMTIGRRAGEESVGGRMRLR